jgi:hypothetical protein
MAPGLAPVQNHPEKSDPFQESQMKLHVNEDKYDENQIELLHNMIVAIKDPLLEAGLTGKKLRDLTTSIAFGISSLIDCSEKTVTDRDEILYPYLAFSIDDNKETGICSEGGSWMHEYVHGTIDDVFDD